MTVDWSIPVDGVAGRSILGTTHLPEASPQGVVLLGHGFKGYKDYGFFPCFANEAARRGLVAHRFNFSHSGMTNRIETFERPDLFEQDTWGKQIFDLQQVAAAAKDARLPGDAPPAAPMTWFGHSRGGVTVILAAWRAAEGHGVKPDRIVPADQVHSLKDVDVSSTQTRGALTAHKSRMHPSNAHGQRARQQRR